MNHWPFEDWLLEDQRLTPQQERELQAHLRTCTACGAILESNLALHTTQVLAAPAGFTERFHVRLRRRRRQQRWQQSLGTLVLVLGGLATLYWLAGSAIQQALDSPAALITTTARYLMYGLTSFRVLSDITLILIRDLSGFVPPIGWLLLFVAAGGFGAIWVFTMRRLARSPQGV